VSVWLLGGLDPTGGAGLIRDAWTAGRFAPKLEVSCAVTAFTQQGRGAPARLRAFPPERFEAAIRSLPPPDAIKLGLIDPRLTGRLSSILQTAQCPVVLDPVLEASDGGGLGAATPALRDLAQFATVVTPNRAEADAFIERETGDLPSATKDALGSPWILLKDAEPGDSNTICDVLIGEGERHRFVRPRQGGPDPRGTGCALSTALACALAQGDSVRDAAEAAISWLDVARQSLTPGPSGHPHLG
jgi:hydroxymethylpyrimidine/phosphomethylpyrimidine kinase